MLKPGGKPKQIFPSFHFEQFDGTLFFDKQIVIEHVQREEVISPSFKRVVTEEIIEKIVSPDNCLCALKTFYPEYEKNASYLSLRTAYRLCL